MLSLITHQGNANQSYNELPFHTYGDARHKKIHTHKISVVCKAGETGNLTYCWWEYKMVPALWEVWQSLKELLPPYCYCSVARSCPTLLWPWNVTRQAPLSMEFSREWVHWSELPFLTPGDLPEPGIKPTSSAWQADSLPLSHLGSPRITVWPSHSTPR